MIIKELLTKEYLKWLFFKVLTNGLIIVSMFHFINEKNSNIQLGIILFVISMITFWGYHRIKPVPKLATCVENSGMFVNIYTNLTMTTGLGLILLVGFYGVEEFTNGFWVTVGIFIAMFLSGLLLYIYSCKKNGIIEKKI